MSWTIGKHAFVNASVSGQRVGTRSISDRWAAVGEKAVRRGANPGLAGVLGLWGVLEAMPTVVAEREKFTRRVGKLTNQCPTRTSVNELKTHFYLHFGTNPSTGDTPNDYPNIFTYSDFAEVEPKTCNMPLFPRRLISLDPDQSPLTAAERRLDPNLVAMTENKKSEFPDQGGHVARDLHSRTDAGKDYREESVLHCQYRNYALRGTRRLAAFRIP
ncbi:hypothetical protein B0H16DRAFT_1469863 [Mycena metata]|uniref:Uncharacterized protein n=1 Tax=Mycena metata TaxID=1033252 RepID=A0AAD7HW20_9AGAR|nr:hypothetical protein B0H16DRAFT_1469863 [Mycena metata]